MYPMERYQNSHDAIIEEHKGLPQYIRLYSFYILDYLWWLIYFMSWISVYLAF